MLFISNILITKTVRNNFMKVFVDIFNIRSITKLIIFVAIFLGYTFWLNEKSVKH